MHWFPSKFSSEIAAASWQHKQSVSLISYLQRPQIHQSLCPALFISAFLGERFSSSLPSSTLNLRCFHLIHLYLFLVYNNTDADYQLHHWIIEFVDIKISVFFKEIVLSFMYVAFIPEKTRCFSKFSFSTIFYMNENVQKIVFLYWRHRQGFSSYLLSKEDLQKLRSQIVWKIKLFSGFIDVFCD